MDVLAFDLGGTRLKAGVLRDGAAAGGVVLRDVPGEVQGVLEALAHAGRAVLGDRTPRGVGLAVPGLVDERGIVVSLPGKHPGLEGYDLPGFLRETFGARAVVCNDAIAYGIGEATAGAGAGCARVVVVTLGTGVGVTVVEGGAPLGTGALGGGLMGGMIPIAAADDGPTDTNGRPDTIEAHCRAQRLLHECGGAYPDVPAVYEAHARGDESARAGVARYRGHLVRALVALASAHAPDRIVLGGGPVADDNPLVPGLEDEVNARLFGSYRTEVRAAALGDGAALAGLAHLLRDA